MSSAVIPLPLLVVLDDVGWWRGEDGHARNEPYRTGIPRNHVPADYEGLAMLGKALNMRVQAAMILCEWDTRNNLRHKPWTQWMGDRWDNASCPATPAMMDEAADILRRNRDWIEITLHGIGHEYWHHDEGGKFTRAEWAGRDGELRPEPHLRGTIEAFAQLLDQHNLGPFPQSFIPCAFRYPFDSMLTDLLREAGVRYVSTPFRFLPGREQAQHELLGVTRGVVTIDRGTTSPAWYDLEVEPATLDQYDVPGPICGLHWPNVLHLDPSRHAEAVAKWVAYLKPLDDRAERMLARDTAACCTQLAYHALATCESRAGEASLDFAKVDALPASALGDELTLKVEAKRDVRFSVEGVTIAQQSHRGGIHTLKLRRRGGEMKATVRWS